MTVDEFFLGESGTPPSEEKKDTKKKEEISLYQIYQLAINRNRLPTKEEYARISDLGFLRDVSCDAQGAIFSNEVQKMRLPKKAFFHYLRSRLWNTGKITNVANRKDWKREIQIESLMLYYEWNRSQAIVHIDLDLISQEDLERAVEETKPILEKKYGKQYIR